MLKLITADIKVLGHRLWIIPVGVFLFVMMFSFIPYLNQVQSFQNWIFAILIPGLLTFELFREEQRNNTDRMLMTMPMNRSKYVYSKYVLVLGFIFIGVVLGVFANYLVEVAGFITIRAHNQFYLTRTLYVFNTTYKGLFFILPIFYFTKRIKLS